MSDNNVLRSPTRDRKKHNKIYRVPTTPPPEELFNREKSFVLDCNAVSSISADYSKANPKLGPVIAPYNAQKDDHVKNYFLFHGVNKTLKKTGQDKMGESIDGKVMDFFHDQGAGFKYLSTRNQNGAGRSREFIDGHASFMHDVKPAIGYNGEFGYRRNTPWLRHKPSSFGSTPGSTTN